MGESRDHAILSPSGASRWMVCTPSARFEQQFPDKSGDAAREGTLAHAICELMLKGAIGGITRNAALEALAHLVDLDLMAGRRIYREENPDATDDEVLEKAEGEFYCHAMMEYCDQYVTFVLEKLSEARRDSPDARLYVEERLDISDWIPESFGTGDAGIPARRVLRGIDLKYGKGVEVSAINNTQMKVYALGWLRDFDQLYDIEEIEMTIFQPRIDNISTWSIPVQELLDWAEKELRPKAVLAFAGTGEFVPGSHCQFCKAKTACKALADYNLVLAKYEFADARVLTDVEISDILRRGTVFKNWIGAIEEHALDLALKQNKKWPGFKLVEGRSNRILTKPEEAAAILAKKGYEEVEVFNKSLKGIGDLEKLLGGKSAFGKMLDHLVIKPKGKPTLVPDSDYREEFNSLNKAVRDFDDDYLTR